MRTLLLTSLFACGLCAQEPFQVKVTGHGPPMILIPGLASSGETWESTVAHYKDRFECHVLTVAGFAGVPRVPAPMLDKIRDGLANYIRKNHLEKPVIVGHSLGGFVGMDFAAKYPDAPGKLVIVDIYPFTMGLDPDMTPAKAKGIATQIRKTIGSMTAEAYEAYSRDGKATNDMATSDADKKRLIEWSLTSDRTAVADAMYELYGADLREEVAKITVPTLVFGTWRGNEGYGANHETVDANLHSQYAKVKGVEIHVTDTARHFIMWDDPGWMFGHMDQFLAAQR